MPLIGGSSLLVVFAVLCLVVFAMLSLSTVEAGGRLSQKTANAVANYYAADAQAEAVVADLRRGKTPEGVHFVDGAYRFAVPISEGQELQVALEVQGDIRNGNFTILQWQVVVTDEWTPDTNIDVWEGES